MKLARLVACAAVAVAATAEEFGTGPARLARCGGPCPGDFLGESLNYLRIAKSGSSSVVLQLRWMNGTNPKCHGLRMNRHETLARHMPPGSANFAVLREPCERFVSMYDHLRYNRRNERILRQKDAMTWAILLRDDPEEREFWLNTFKRVEDDEAISWPQTAYVGNDTKTACLPTLREDLWAILDDALPGCATKQLNQLAVNRVRVFGRRTDRGKREVGHTVQQTPALCSVVNEVYADDVRLWRSRCGARA
mmetsp:Transcript_2114/g.6002  ORF Transcript_2114/g.6002 Transcript_2114/m.6002 type:complete len:251 (+) Transcript_2114:241-993(+)